MVNNNPPLGVSRQEILFSKLSAPRSSFVAIAHALHPAVDLERAMRPDEALRPALRSACPALVRAPTAAEHHVLPMLAPGAANSEALDYAPTLASNSVAV